MSEESIDKRSLPVLEMRSDLTASYHSCLGVVARERRYIGFLEAPPLASSQEWVDRVLAKTFPFMVVLFGNDVVGWCDIGPHDRIGFEHMGTLGTAVHPDFRGYGLGPRLIQAAVQRADAIGLERIELEVFGSNKRAQAVYEKLGFQVEGVRRRARKVDGIYDDVIIMARLRSLA